VKEVQIMRTILFFSDVFIQKRQSLTESLKKGK